MKIIWTEQAVEKLEEYADYIALDKPNAALRWAKKIQKSVENLEKFPMLGREVPELKRPDIRELIEGEYRIIYRLESHLISVLTIYHSKQLLKKSEIFKRKNK
jgi:plasmid stabilization system protein ParE